MRSSFAAFSCRPVAHANEYWHSALLRWVNVCRAKGTKGTKWFTIANCSVAAAARPITSLQRAALYQSALSVSQPMASSSHSRICADDTTRLGVCGLSVPAHTLRGNRIGKSAQMVGLLETVNRCGNAFHSRFQLEGQKLGVVA
jgi:hypothetical protein